MITVSADIHRAAIAYGVVSGAGAKVVRRPALTMSGYSVDGGSSAVKVLEFATASGEVVSRKVEACGRSECWLRQDLALQALAATAEAAAEMERIKSVMTAEMNRKDQALADARGETLEHFRTQRNYRGMRWDRYRHAQRAGG